MKKSLIALLCLFALALSGANRIFNGNFRCGTAGFGLFRLLREENNPQYEFNGLFVENGKLALNNPFGEYFQICSMEFELPERQKITFRSDFTAPAGTQIAFTVLRITPEHKWLVHNRTLPATGNAQKVEFSFDTKNHGGSYMMVVYPLGNPVGNYRFGHFTIDGGKAGGLFALVNTDRKYYVLGEHSKADFTVVIDNPADRPETGTLTLLSRDQELGTAGAKPISQQITLKPGCSQFAFSMPVTRYGFFRIKALWNGKAIRCIDGIVPVIGRYQGERKIDFTKTFVVSVNGNPAADWQGKRGNSIGGFSSCGETPEDKLKFLEMMGCRLIRDWDSSRDLCKWLDIEPEEGKFDFTRFDRELARLDKYGITIFPVVGRMYENWASWQTPFRPEWLNKKLIHIAKNPPRTDPKFKINVPPTEIWERYLEAIVRHAGDRIPFYEIMNEPNLNLFPSLYLEYLKSSYRAIKRVSPKTLVIGICSTGDLGADCENYFRDCIELGAADYADWLSFHPYNNRTLDSIAPADRQIRYLKSISQGKPLFNTEIYYLYDWPNLLDGAGQSNCHARHVTSRFLLDLGEGLIQSSCITQKQLWMNRLLPNFHNSYPIEKIPNDCFVAYNALARLFEGGKPAGKFKSDNGAVIYRYTRNSKPQGTAWQYRKNCTLELDCKGMEVLDVFGNRIDSERILLTENPVYLFPGKLSEKEFIRRLDQPQIRILDPVRVAPVGRLHDGKLYLTLWNAAPLAVRTTLLIPGTSEIVSAEVPASGSKVIPVRCDGKNPVLPVRIGEGKTETKVGVVRSDSARCGETFAGKSADGKLSFTGKVTAENGKTVISVQVKDATPSGPANGRDLWQQDCAELFIHTDALKLSLIRPEVYTSQVSRFFINPYLPKQLSLQSKEFRLADCPCKVKILPDGYAFTLTLPKYVPVLGFGIKVDDALAFPRVREAAWGAGGKSYKDHLSFGLISAAPAQAVKYDPAGILPAGKILRLTGNHQKPCAFLYSGKTHWNTIPGKVTEYFYFADPVKLTVKGDLQNVQIEDVPELCGNLLPENDLELFWSGDGKIADSSFPAGGKSVELIPGKQFFSRYLPMVPGKTSVFTFWANAEKEGIVDVVLNSWSRYAHRGKHCYTRQHVKILPGWHYYEVRWLVPEENKAIPDLSEHLLKIQFIPQASAQVCRFHYQAGL